MCPPMIAHWRHLANTIELVHPSAHLSPHAKRQIDRFSRSCTTHGRKCHTLQWAPLSTRIVLSHGGIWTPCNIWFRGPMQAHNPNGTSIGSAFLHEWPEYPDTLQWFACFPLKIGGSGSHVIHGSLGPPKSWTQAASRSLLPFLHSSLVRETDRPIDRPTDLVGNNRPHVLWCGVIMRNLGGIWQSHTLVSC